MTNRGSESHDTNQEIHKGLGQDKQEGGASYHITTLLIQEEEQEGVERRTRGVYYEPRLVARLLKAERRFRDRSDPLALPEDILYERYRFSSEGIRYLIVLVGPYVGNATKRSRALTVAQCVCVSLRFVATGTYLHTVGDAENISKNAVCLAIHKVVAALHVVFPSFLPTQTVKEGFYQHLFA
ncbi:putative nuclease HARBI1 [Merluccius polli]|uniref:Nuclease HARBI1 n=1 Tax=Merluccius polli TaxID=89951 RepID=A0AA47N2D0_MERPO|nr:putative nuclease HARBI1 [Merluccius polli]